MMPRSSAAKEVQVANYEWDMQSNHQNGYPRTRAIFLTVQPRVPSKDFKSFLPKPDTGNYDLMAIVTFQVSNIPLI